PAASAGARLHQKQGRELRPLDRRHGEDPGQDAGDVREVTRAIHHIRVSSAQVAPEMKGPRKSGKPSKIIRVAEAFVSLAIFLFVSAQSWSAERFTCMQGGYTTECSHGQRLLRVIQDTMSADGRYGIAWEVPSQAALKIEDDGSEYLPHGESPNFLIR